MIGSFKLEDWHEGPPGTGQGGYSAYRFSEIVGQSLSVRLHSPIPLGAELVVDRDGNGRYTVSSEAGSAAESALIMSGTPSELASYPTPTVTVEDARRARESTDLHLGIHGAPNCFSCGINRESMGVHPGPLPDGRFATDLTPPDWALTADGHVDPWAFWAALDCTAGVYVATDETRRIVVTANYQVKMHKDRIEPGTFAVVAHPIDTEWDGRKKWAASSAFDANGVLVAEALSLWVSLGMA